MCVCVVVEGGGLRSNTYTNKTNLYHRAKQKQTNKEKITCIEEDCRNVLLVTDLVGHNTLYFLPEPFTLRFTKMCKSHLLCSQIEPVQSPLSKTLGCIILDTKNLKKNNPHFLKLIPLDIWSKPC